ncbi:MAG: hypothetical protein ABSE42_15275 [Bryobacteraceae bacterium]|jgi:hypothetical protein
MFSSFISTHSMAAVPLCALMAGLAALVSLWTEWDIHPLRAELQNPGRESAEDFYY